MSLHRGINTTSVASEGFEGLPGLIMAIAFVFMPLGIFLPRHSNGILAVFLFVEATASLLYIRAARRDRRDAERAARALHEINERRN